MKREITCIECPMGCSLEVTYDDKNVTEVKGNECPRGKNYAFKEIFCPERIVTTTVRIKGAPIPILPVKTEKAVPKKLCLEVVREASKVTVKAPIRAGDTIIRNILGTDINLIATRTVEKI